MGEDARGREHQHEGQVSAVHDHHGGDVTLGRLSRTSLVEARADETTRNHACSVDGVGVDPSRSSMHFHASRTVMLGIEVARRALLLILHLLSQSWRCREAGANDN
jgi:hypothetical protein